MKTPQETPRMRIEDLTQLVVEATTPVEVDAALKRRARGDYNAFWLSHLPNEYPVLHIAVNGEVSYVHFFPGEGHPGFQSVAPAQPTPDDVHTSFLMTALGDEMQVPSTSVVPFIVAVNASNEFARSRKLPDCVTWIEL
jgi:Immunity protein Imm1